MVVHPAYGNWTGTLVNGLLYYTQQNLSKTDQETLRPGIVHRLDKDTSGLLVVAKTDDTHQKLAKQFAKKKPERKYWAIVWGNPPDEGTIEANIGRSPSDRKIMTVLPEGGKSAVTHYRKIETFDHLALLEIHLETGRTHQIRVHMQHAGYYVFGDKTYGGDSVRYGPNTGSRKSMFKNLFDILERQALHAKTLGFVHPATDEFVEFNSPLPPDFQNVLDKLRENCKTKTINIEVVLDENNIPEEIKWSATDLQGFDEAVCRAMILSLWDHKNKDTLRLDLWTKDMTVDEMKIFFHQTLVTMADTLENSTNDKRISGDMRDFCVYFAEKMEIAE